MPRQKMSRSVGDMMAMSTRQGYQLAEKNVGGKNATTEEEQT